MTEVLDIPPDGAELDVNARADVSDANGALQSKIPGAPGDRLVGGLERGANGRRSATGLVALITGLVIPNWAVQFLHRISQSG
jgi:hypothetical protein